MSSWLSSQPAAPTADDQAEKVAILQASLQSLSATLEAKTKEAETMTKEAKEQRELAVAMTKKLDVVALWKGEGIKYKA